MNADTITIAFIGSLPGLVTAIGGLIVSLRNGRKVQEVKDKQDTTINAVAEVHKATNGNLTKVTDQLTSANDQLSSLKDVIAKGLGQSMGGQVIPHPEPLTPISTDAGASGIPLPPRL
jgi:hypothetical protein